MNGFEEFQEYFDTWREETLEKKKFKKKKQYRYRKSYIKQLKRKPMFLLL